MADNYDDYYSDSDEIEEEVKVPKDEDFGEYRQYVAPITEEDVKQRRRVLKERRVKRVTGVPEDQMNKIINEYRTIYGKNPESLLLRQPHKDSEYDEYGNLTRVNVFDRTAQRKTAAEANKNKLRAKIKEITGKDLDGWEMDQIAAVARRQNAAANKARNRAIRAAMRQKGVLPSRDSDEYKQQLADKKQRKYRSRIHQYYPRLITDKSLEPYLEKPEYRGDKTYDDPVYDDFVDSRTGLQIFKDWVGRTPQQLTVEERNRAAMLFGEMSGLLGLHPKYDRRFLTAASAKAALNDREGKYYNYQMYDMDNDKRSPGTLVVSRKDNGQIIAVDGYLLDDAKESAEVQRLRDMVYFNENPTPGHRKANPKSEFMKEKKLMKTKKSVGLKAVKEFIEDYITQVLKIVPPTTVWNRQQRKRIQTPTYIDLNAGITRAPVVTGSMSVPPLSEMEHIPVISYKVPMIAWRSIISSVAELFANMFIYPRIPFGEIGLEKFRQAFLEAPFTNLKDQGRQLVVAKDYYQKWMQTYTHDTVLAYVLGNKYVQYYIDQFVEEYKASVATSKALNNVIQVLINIACMFHMNGLEYIMRELRLKPNDYELFFLRTPMYLFVNKPAMEPFDTLTSRSWEKVEQQWGIQYMGANLVSTLKRSDVQHPEYNPQTRQSTLQDYGYVGNYVAPKKQGRRLMQLNQDDNLSEVDSDDSEVRELLKSSSSSSSNDALLSTPMLTSTQTVQQQLPFSFDPNVPAFTPKSNLNQSSSSGLQ